jgi:hypothetical protein
VQVLVAVLAGPVRPVAAAGIELTALDQEIDDGRIDSFGAGCLPDFRFCAHSEPSSSASR